MKHKIYIRKKIILAICLSGLIIIITGIGSGYFFGMKLLKKAAIENYQRAENLPTTSVAYAKGRIILYNALLQELTAQLAVLTGVLLTMMISLGLIFGGVLTGPIEKLREGIERIGKGNLDFKVEVKTGDELEELADSFNQMAKDLKRTTVSIDILNKEVDARRTAEERLKDAYEKLRMIQAGLIRAAKMEAVGQLAAGAAHEIGNPISVISGEAEMLLMNANTDDKTKEASKTIIEQIERIESITTRLLSFSRRGAPVSQPIDVNRVIEESMLLVSYQIKSENLKVVPDLAGGLPGVRGDENELKEVFINIILNAAQSMEERGALKIRTDNAEIREDKNGKRIKGVKIEFRDTGKGMDEETVSRLFEPFFSTKDYGMGLGLFVSYGIIKSHGGDIEVHSKPGEGSVFTVRLPVYG